jgi:hypothetical protein
MEASDWISFLRVTMAGSSVGLDVETKGVDADGVEEDGVEIEGVGTKGVEAEGIA